MRSEYNLDRFYGFVLWPAQKFVVDAITAMGG